MPLLPAAFLEPEASTPPPPRATRVRFASPTDFLSMIFDNEFSLTRADAGDMANPTVYLGASSAPIVGDT